MDALEELKILIQRLSMAEKRYVRLLGNARAGGSGSQVLDLLDWLYAGEHKQEPIAAQPFAGNLPTLVARLKQLILNALTMLGTPGDIDAELCGNQAHIAALQAKELHAPALRLLKRAKRRALQTSRYLAALALLAQEQRSLRAIGAGTAQWAAFYAEEDAVHARYLALRDLQQRHNRLLTLVRHVALHRNAATADEVDALTQGTHLAEAALHGSYLEQALAVNILCIRHCLDRNPQAAIERYAILLRDWQAHPAWLLDQASLLATVCNYFQSACFYSDLGWEAVRGYLRLVPDFEALAPQAARDYQRMLHHGRFTPALNTANFESVKALIPEIDAWLAANGPHLTEAQVLPFLHNFAVATFILEEHWRANHYVQRILQLPNRKVRTDIREFALVLQAILQYEMGNVDLNEYLTRAGKRHFSKAANPKAFEYAVFDFLTQAMRSTREEQVAAALDTLQAALDQLAGQVSAAVPLLGLTEVRLWVSAKQRKVPLRVVFQEAVQEVLAAMG